MKERLLVTLLSMFLLTSGCSLADSQPETPPITSSLPFTNLKPCFAGDMSSYDKWADGRLAQYPSTNRGLIEQRFPRVEFENYQANLECHTMTYTVDGFEVDGLYVRPKVKAGRKLPVVIVNRSGNGPFGALRFAQYFHGVFPLADAGFAVLASQYRGGRRNGDPAVNGTDEFGGRDVNDVLALVDMVASIPDLDPERIGMYGWSRGGMMAYLAASKTSSIKALAVMGTPTDLQAELALRPEMAKVFEARIPDYKTNPAEALAARSPLLWAETLPTAMPVLILHGQVDNRVSLTSATKMMHRLTELKRPSRLVVYERGTHYLLRHGDDVKPELIAWFKEHL